MDAPDHRKPQSSGNESHGAHICNKCGWQYPNPHPSAKHRRAHKKICGTIEVHKLVDSGKTKPVPGLDDEHQSDDEHKNPLEKTMIGGTGAISSRSEEEVFADAVCEFSQNDVSPSSDSSEGNKKSETTDFRSVTKISATCSGENQQCTVSTTTCKIRNAEVSDSGKVPPAVEGPVPSSMRTAIMNQIDDKNSAEDGSLSVESEILIDSSQEAQVIDVADKAKYGGLETEQNGNQPITAERNPPNDFASETSPVGKREDVGDTIWNDEVVYSEVEAPDGFVEEKLGIFQSTEDERVGTDNASDDASLEKTNVVGQYIGTGDSVVSTEHGQGITADKDDVPSFSAHDAIPPVEMADVSLHELKDHRELKLHQSPNLGPYEANDEEECKRKRTDYAETLGIVQSGQLCIGMEGSSSETIVLEGKNEDQGRNGVAAVEELAIQDKVEVSKIENSVGTQPEESMIPKDIEIKADKFEASESPFGTSQNTVVSEKLTAAFFQLDHVNVDKDVDANCTGNVVSIVDKSGCESNLFQANAVAGEDNRETVNEGNNAEGKIISESTGISECYVSSVLNVPEGSYDSDRWKGSTEACKDSSPINDAEICENNDEAQTGSSGGLEKINILTETTNTQKDALGHSGSAVITSGTVKSDDQELLKSRRTDFGGISGVPEVTERDEIDNNGGMQSDCTDVPMAVESDCGQDFRQLQNPSEAHILPLGSSVMAAGDASLASDGVCEHKSQPLLTGDYATFVGCQNNNSGGDMSVHSSNKSDGLEVNQGSVSVLPLQSDMLVSLDAELKNTDTKPPSDAPCRNNTEKSSESRDDKYSTVGLNSETAPLEIPSQPSSVAQTTSEEIIEKITNQSDQSTIKQQHVPLKHLLSEARSPRQSANNNASSVIPRVRSILGPETSTDSGSSGKGEASEEWKKPGNYPVGMKREERKVKGRPFWVPFVCCSSPH